ncbi:MAG: cytosine permease [Actinomycetales bacterium]|nr:cytosine permease [Actinomycetales bacterium]
MAVVPDDDAPDTEGPGAGSGTDDAATSGPRRSNFLPPPAPAGPPANDYTDDDALAAALEADLRLTGPITIPTFPASEVPLESRPGVTMPDVAAPVEHIDAGERPGGAAPLPPVWGGETSGSAAPAAAPAPDAPAGPTASETPDADHPAWSTEFQRHLGGEADALTTAEAIERLQQELSRRAAGRAATGSVDPAPAAPERVSLEPTVIVPPSLGAPPSRPIEAPEPDIPLARDLTDAGLEEPAPPPDPDPLASVPRPARTGEVPTVVGGPTTRLREEVPPPPVPRDAPPPAAPDLVEPPMLGAPPPPSGPAALAAMAPPGGPPAALPPVDPLTGQVLIPALADEPDTTDTAPSGVIAVAEPIAAPAAASAPASGADELAPIDAADDRDPLAAGASREGDDPAVRPRTPPALRPERPELEPTPLDLRAGRSVRMFWLWFAPNASLVSVALGALLLSRGMSLRQAIVATLIGVALSFLPLGLGTLAGRGSGQPTLVVSRATFGHYGNLLPAGLAVLSRLFFAAVLLWLLATGVAHVLHLSGLDAGLSEQLWTSIALLGGAVIVVVVGTLGYGLIVRLQLVLTIAALVLVAGTIVLTFPKASLATALTIPDGPWALVLGGAVLVFSVVGLAWVHSSSDLARYQRPQSWGGSTMLWSTFGATLPAFALVSWGAVLAASDAQFASRLTSDPLAAVASLLPLWYPAPVMLAAGIPLLSGAILSVYSGAFAIASLGLRARRGLLVLVTALLAALVASGIALLLGDAAVLLTEMAVTIAVPVAAWAGLFAAEAMIRVRPLHAESLLRPGGVYPAVRVVNLLALLLASAVGFGFTTASQPGLDWQGYLWSLLPLDASDASDALRQSDAGVLVALALGLLVPIVAGIPAIRAQERRSGILFEDELPPDDAAAAVVAPVVREGGRGGDRARGRDRDRDAERDRDPDLDANEEPPGPRRTGSTSIATADGFFGDALGAPVPDAPDAPRMVEAPEFSEADRMPPAATPGRAAPIGSAVPGAAPADPVQLSFEQLVAVASGPPSRPITLPPLPDLDASEAGGGDGDAAPGAPGAPGDAPPDAPGPRRS